MAVYAIGDIQGCYAPLQALLLRLAFDPARDRLWFTGDLVNRGPDSLATLRFVKSLGEAAITVLGNHDLHLLAIAHGHGREKRLDTLHDVLNAPDRDDLLGWLRSRPLMHHDATLNYTLVHAGLLPQWDLVLAQSLAREVESVLRQDPAGLFAHMYGDRPDRWDPGLAGWDRVRVVINGLTRVRYCDRDGRMDPRPKGAPGTQPVDLMPWFAVPDRRNADLRLIFGHWSTLGVGRGAGWISLDSGCVWGQSLTAVRLDGDDADLIAVPCTRCASPLDAE